MDELDSTAASVLDLAISGEDLEAYVVHKVAVTVQVGADASIRRVDRSETRGVGLRLFRDGRVGYSSTADLQPAALATAVRRARSNAGACDPDPPNLPPEPQPADALTGLLDHSLSAMSLDDKIAIATGLARAVTGLDPRVSGVDTAEYQDERTEVAIASTRGVRVEQERGHAFMFVDALGEDSHGRASDEAYWCGRDPDGSDVERLARDAVQRTTRLLGPRLAVPPGLPVLLDGAVAAELLVAVGRGCTGGALGTGRSPFAHRSGESVGSGVVTLTDDGRGRGFADAAMYDDEGVPRRRTELIVHGKLTGALHSTATAHAMGAGARSTGSARRLTHRSAPRAAPVGLALTPTTHLEALLAVVPDAVYLQQLSGAGMGIDAVTGRVDVGGVGWLLRRGEPVGPLATVLVASDLLTFLRSITHVVDDGGHMPFTPVRAGIVGCASQLLW